MIEVDCLKFSNCIKDNNLIAYYQSSKDKSKERDLVSVILDIMYYSKKPDVARKYIKLINRLFQYFVIIDLSFFQVVQYKDGKVRFFEAYPDEGKENLFL